MFDKCLREPNKSNRVHTVFVGLLVPIAYGGQNRRWVDNDTIQRRTMRHRNEAKAKQNRK